MGGAGGGVLVGHKRVRSIQSTEPQETFFPQ